MKIKCIGNSGRDLSLKALEAGHFLTTEFDLKVGDVYMVYGISLWKGIIQYLTMDKQVTLPFWYPADLFVVLDNLLPMEWYYRFFGHTENCDLTALWGYRELVLDENHYTALIDRESEAIRIFLKRKREIDENT